MIDTIIGVFLLGVWVSGMAAAGVAAVLRSERRQRERQAEADERERLLLLGLNSGVVPRAACAGTWGVDWGVGGDHTWQPPDWDWWDDETRSAPGGGPQALENTLPVVIRDENSGGYWTILTGYTGNLGGNN